MLQPADPNQETVTITRPMFERIEDRRKEVAENESRLNRIAEDHKAAKKAFDASRDTLDALVSEMIRVVNGGPSDLPLFDNMNDRLEEAQKDPVAQTLLDSLITHGYTDLNLLIVHGYTEAERGELAAYLDSLDRLQAWEEMPIVEAGERPDVLPEPAFISADAIAQRQDELTADAPTDAQIEAALAENDIQFMPGHAFMDTAQRIEAIAWAQACAAVRAEKREDLTFDDLPTAPAFVLDPKSLLPDEMDGRELEPEQAAEPEKKSRAKRRSSKAFKNTVKDQVKAKKGKK